MEKRGTEKRNEIMKILIRIHDLNKSWIVLYKFNDLSGDKLLKSRENRAAQLGGNSRTFFRTWFLLSERRRRLGKTTKTDPIFSSSFRRSISPRPQSALLHEKKLQRRKPTAENSSFPSKIKGSHLAPQFYAAPFLFYPYWAWLCTAHIWFTIDIFILGMSRTQSSSPCLKMVPIDLGVDSLWY